ncbi:EI24 domain-containing protein [Roseomonas cutis]|uniref:EI24 domain-containing protein n=1 Tax=Roseomonas cutis TaxID=2897332 RepID=UPI00272CD24D|nr:EI24 domain-containing protein [Roseomonas sp. OT10]
MSAVLASLLLPLRQIADPAFRGPLVKGVLGALLAFAGLVALSGWGVSALAGGEGWIATLAGTLGGLLALFSAVWLFVPVALAIGGLFTDPVAAAVEHRYYPALPPPRGASLAAQARFNIALAAKMLAVTLVVLPLSWLLPVVGVVALWAVAAVALGQGMFEGVAQRRMGVAEARALRRRRWPAVYAVGGALAALAAVPLANLLVPVLGTAAMTHLLHRGPDGPVTGGLALRPARPPASGATA